MTLDEQRSLRKSFSTLGRALITEIRWKCCFAAVVALHLINDAVRNWGSWIALFYVLGVACLSWLIVYDLVRVGRIQHIIEELL